MTSHRPKSDSPVAFTFDSLQESDLPMLREWLERPHCAKWWGPAESLEELHQDYVAHANAPNATRAYIAKIAGEPVGFIQCYVVMGSGGGWWEGETDPGARGIDQFLANEGDLGQGLGRVMVRSFVERLFEDDEVTVVQTDPDPRNERAIRCYTRAGFEAASVVTTPDGPALLMRWRRPAGTIPR